MRLIEKRQRARLGRAWLADSDSASFPFTRPFSYEDNSCGKCQLASFRRESQPRPSATSSPAKQCQLHRVAYWQYPVDGIHLTSPRALIIWDRDTRRPRPCNTLFTGFIFFQSTSRPFEHSGIYPKRTPSHIFHLVSCQLKIQHSQSKGAQQDCSLLPNSVHALHWISSLSLIGPITIVHSLFICSLPRCYF